MDIAAELQQEASERAGSPEGFMQVIRLVLDKLETREEVSPSFFNSPDLQTCPEWSWPDSYLPVFREYVILMQEAIRFQRHIYDLDGLHRWPHVYGKRQYVPDEYKAAQKKLSDMIHAAKSKKRELPIHAYKRLLAIEDRNASRWGGRENMYLPVNWEGMSALVEAYISNFGVARHKEDPAYIPNHEEASYGDC